MSMLRRVQNLLNHSIFVRTVGSLSCVVGLLCYALSSSFKSLFGEWNPSKIVLYIILNSITSVLFLFEPKSRFLVVISKLKPHVELLVLMLTSLYSFFADRSTKGEPDTLSVASFAFVLTFVCLSRQIKPVFGVVLFCYFFGCVAQPMMHINRIFIRAVATAELFPWDLQGRERQQRELQRQQLEQWEEHWELIGEEQWEQPQERLQQEQLQRRLRQRLQRLRRMLQRAAVAAAVGAGAAAAAAAAVD